MDLSVFSFLYFMVFVHLGEQGCYKGQFAGFYYGFNPKFVRLHDTFHTNSRAMVNADVFYEIKNPTWNLQVLSWTLNKGYQIFFNNTLRSCVVLRQAPRDLIASTLISLIPTLSNLSLSCPFPAGAYYVDFDGAHVNNVVPVRLFYQPNAYLFIGVTFYDQVPAGNLTFLAVYKGAVVIENSCARRKGKAP